MLTTDGAETKTPARIVPRRRFAQSVRPTYLGVVLLEDDEVPVPLDEVLPVPDVPLVAPELVPMLLDGLVLELDDEDGLDGAMLLELDGEVLELLLELGVEDEVSGAVVELEDDEAAGGVGGVLVVLLLVLVPEGGATTVVLSLRSHPARPAVNAIAKALVNKILDFMGTPFVIRMGQSRNGGGRPFRWRCSQVRCHG